jgi:thiol-disulfide isomerase/thioredoxin
MKNLKSNVCVWLFFITGLFILPFKGNAQPGKHKYSATLNVIVKNSSMLKGTILTFIIQQKGINTGFIGYTNDISLRMTKKSATIKLPLSTPINYITILETKNGLPDDNRVFEKLNGLFIVQDGDKIQLHLSTKRNEVFFTGNNSAKYNCRYNIGNNIAWSVTKFNYYWGIGDYKRAFESGKLQHDSIFQVQRKILTSFKNKIDKRIFQLMYLDILSCRDQNIAGQYCIPFLMKKTYAYAVANKFFTDNFGNKHQYDSINPVLATQSYFFSDLLSFLETMSVVIAKTTPAESYYSHLSFANIDSAINHDYNKGLVKDKLMLLSFLSMDHRRQGDYVDYTKKTVYDCTNSIFRYELIEFEKRNRVGSSTFNFALPDVVGNQCELNDFKGKLVVIDFWFDGCAGCKGMAPVLKSIVEHYKPNPNIVFLSVCTDRNIDLWKKSVKEELYCSKDEINLLAQNGNQSEIIKYFNVNAYPTLVIMSKDGKLISTAPPDPRIDAQKFIEFIDDHLKQKNPN